ncbi:hypothetical protein [Geobacter sp.]|uniref:hypothetical protein n=1 Tax=Geobacter sp. TaxID=46610 RepID=UPI002606429A|nr:hypothetical protein [Geobacter sp.]
MRPILMIAVAATVALLSGCAVIDFLDGKHYNHTPGYDRPQYDSGSYGGGHGGHSH